MLAVHHFRDLIIRPALEAMPRGASNAAVELLLGTALQESNLTYLKQLGSGPALGLFQMEPATHDDIWTNFLKYDDDWRIAINRLRMAYETPSAGELVGNLLYAAAMTRAHYWRVSEALPQAGDVAAMAAYWKEYYNTFEGAGTVEEYIENYNEATFGL